MNDVNVYLGSGKEGFHDRNFQALLLEERFTLKDLKNITYRTINYWHKNDFLLSKPRELPKGWRKFNFVEFVWILLIDELRELGVSLEKNVPQLLSVLGHKNSAEVGEELQNNLEKIKEKKVIATKQFQEVLNLVDQKFPLKRDHPEFEDSKFKAAYILFYAAKSLPRKNFSRLVANCITNKQPASIRIYKDKIELRIASEEKFKGEDLKKEVMDSYQTFISISINKILENLLKSDEYDNLPLMPLLNENEMELFTLVKNRDVKEITIKLREGKPVYMEIKDTLKAPDTAKRVAEFLLSPYEEIKFVTNGDKKVSFERTTKVKL